MSDAQLSMLTKLLQELVTQNKQNKSDSNPPKRILRTVAEIAKDMDLDFNSIPQKSFRGCGKFVKDEYIKHYDRCPLQTPNRHCLYTKKEVKFVRPMIKRYFEMKTIDNNNDNSSEKSE